MMGIARDMIVVLHRSGFYDLGFWIEGACFMQGYF